MRKIILVAGAAATMLMPATAMANTGHHSKPH